MKLNIQKFALIEFEDLPSTDTPLTADNLNNNFEYLENNEDEILQQIGDISDLETTSSNDLVDAINSILPVILYSNSSGTTENIELSDNVTNFSRIDIEYLLETQYDTTVVYSPNSKKAILSTIYITSGGACQMSSEEVTISGTQITRGTRNYVDVSIQGSVARGTGSNPTKITKVIGYK